MWKDLCPVSVSLRVSFFCSSKKVGQQKIVEDSRTDEKLCGEDVDERRKSIKGW